MESRSSSQPSSKSAVDGACSNSRRRRILRHWGQPGNGRREPRLRSHDTRSNYWKDAVLMRTKNNGSAYVMVILSVLVSYFSYQWWFNPQRAIKRQLSNLAAALSAPPDGGG